MSALHDKLDLEKARALPNRLLRVFGGRLSGAEHALAPGQALRIGHGFDNTLVLRGRGTAGIAVTLRVDPDAVAIEVVSGSVTLLGCPLGEGAHALLPPYVPLVLGEYAFAIGDPEGDRWEEVAGLITSPPAVRHGIVEPATGPGMSGWMLREGEALAARMSYRPRPLLLVGASLALLAAAVAYPAYQMVEGWVQSPAAIEQNLAVAGFGSLKVRRDPLTRALVVEGRVRDDAQVEGLRRYVNGRFDHVALNVTTWTAAAAAVTEFLKAQSIDAEARPGRDAIVVHSEYLPGDRLAALRARIAKDLPDAGPTRFVRDLARGPHDLQYFFASKRFGLASMVDGDPGHLVTADGQYWFAGALLPTGHRLVSIGHGWITFERDGLVETLQVVPQGASVPPSSSTTYPLEQRRSGGPAPKELT